MWKICNRNTSGKVINCQKKLSLGIEAGLILSDEKSEVGCYWLLRFYNDDINSENVLTLATIPHSPEITDVFHAADEILRDFCGETLERLK